MKVKIRPTYKKSNAIQVEDWDITRVTEESRKFVAKPAIQVVGGDDDDDESLEPPQQPWRASDDLHPSYEDHAGPG